MTILSIRIFCVYLKLLYNIDMIIQNTVAPRYLREVGSRTPADTKIHGCSSPLYKMAQYLHIIYAHTTIFFILFYFIYLFLAALGLHCCTQAFSSCGERRLLVAVRRLLLAVASLVAEHELQARGLQQLWHTGLVAPQHVGSSWTRDRNCVPCIGR